MFFDKTIQRNLNNKWRNEHFQLYVTYMFSVQLPNCDHNEVIMMTSSNGTIFRVTGPLCGAFTGQRWIPRTKASDTEFWCFLWSAWLSKQSWGWWFETPSCSLWRHCIALWHHMVPSILPNISLFNILSPARRQATIRNWSHDINPRNSNHITMTSQWEQLRLKSPASRLFIQPFIQTQIKANIKAPRHWPFVRGIHRSPVNSPHKRPVMGKLVPFDDVENTNHLFLKKIHLKMPSVTWYIRPGLNVHTHECPCYGNIQMY